MTLRKNLVQFTECCQRFLPLPLFVCGVGLPVVSPFNAVSSFLDQLVEQVDRLLPLAFVQRSGALFIKPIGAFTLAFLTLLFAVLFLLYFFLILSLLLALALLFFLRLARLVLVVVVVVPALCPLRGLFLRCGFRGAKRRECHGRRRHEHNENRPFQCFHFVCFHHFVGNPPALPG